MTESAYDAILFVSFGGPECRDDVIPFLENVLRGKPVPRERMLEVAEHYYHFDGVSPINQQTRELISAVTTELHNRGINLPIYWGNRNWSPLLPDTLLQMHEDGVQRAIAFVTAAYSSYSSCRQYRENIAAARTAANAESITVDKVRVFYNHPDFIAANADRIREARLQLPETVSEPPYVLFTAHSIPTAMADASPYVRQLTESCRLVADQCDLPADRWRLVYQSRSGRPETPWLEPDINDALRSLHQEGAQQVILSPIGFLSDHMEVLFDLDEEARATCETLALPMARAATVGVHPRFVSMVCDLLAERLFGDRERAAIGQYGPNWDVCPVDCCPAPLRPAASARPQSQS